ncbi:TraU family protein [Thiomicrorhabdus indica]|uniref:TraU family protein n=1 Tax=Thiomicrorhabdus indica TaxID=2267253 RepID=UPI0013EE4BA8|nr:TraU family protein [Thiomicrorhabdus indica]
MLTMPAKSSQAATFTSLDAIETSINPQCIDYCLIGVCVHLVCSLSGCSISTSARIRHNLPDLIVSVYDQVEEQPWQEFRQVQSQLVGFVGNKGADLDMGEYLASDFIFKNASVVGHPFMLFAGDYTSSIGSISSSIYVDFVQDDPDTKNEDESWTDKQKSAAINAAVNSIQISGLNKLMGDSKFMGFCPSKITPFFPYYDSTVDMLEWRFGIVDRIQSIVKGYHLPGQREIGSRSGLNLIGNSWGSVWPRIGTVMQQEDPKAAAVIAQRAVDIATNADDWRISVQAKGSRANEKRDLWQMISPKKDRTCKAFGSKSTGIDTWSTGRNPDGKNQYGWNYWRGYECCTDNLPLLKVVYTPEICLTDIFK